MRDPSNKEDSNGLASVLADYLSRIDRGEAICREKFLAEHPKHVAALREYFADVDLLERLAGGSATISSVEAAATPREFGDYDLLCEIGRGGMGIVYRARERSTGRCIALKMLLHGWFLSSAEVRRFRNESSTAAALRHPGIMPIYHVGEHQGRLFYTMPLVEGSNLAERIADGPLDPQFAARLLLAVAEAVAAAHTLGIIHRDLKPANVLLDEHEVPYVADFGLARRLSEEQLSITVTGDLLGTPNYMAPEQVNGHHALVGPLADVYALGAVLYAMLVGQAPFQSESVSETLHKICTVDPVRPRQIRRSVPRDLETICLKCLEKSHANRYPSAGELAEDLRRFLAGKPLLAQPVSQLERGRRWFVRNPVVGTLTIGIALALIVGTGFSLHYARQAGQREQQALANLYAADMNLAQQHVRSGAVASALRLLERHRVEPGASENQGWEWRHLWHQCHGELRRFEGPQGAVYAAAFSPDGRTVAAAGADRIVWLWETATGKVAHKLPGHTATVRDLAFAPDGKCLVTVGDDRIGLVWDTTTGNRIATLVVTGGTPVGGLNKSTGEPPVTTIAHERPLTTVAFSSDGRFIATAGNDEASVNVWDAKTYALQQSLDVGPADNLAFAPDDARLAIAGRDGQVRVYRRDDMGTWTIATTISAHTNIVRGLAWSSDGSRLATAGKDRAVKLWDADSWRELSTVRALKNSIYDISFSPGDRRLAIAARNEPLIVSNLDQQQIEIELFGHTALVTSVEYCPDGWRLVSASEDGTVRLWDATQVADHYRLEGHLGQVRSVAFSPSGNLLVSGSAQDSSAILWNPITGRPHRVMRSPRDHISDMAFSPDGRFLAFALGYDQGSISRLHICEVATNREILDLAFGPGALVGVAWAPDGSRLAIQAADGTTRLVEAKSGRVLASSTSPGGDFGSVAFSEDGKRLVATVGDAFIRILRSDSLSLVHDLRGHTAPVVNAAFDPHGSLIASSSSDHTIRLWDSATGRRLRTLTGHSGTPFGLAFSPDGTRLASSSTDQTVKLWDVATGLELQSLTGHTDWARDVAFSPDGQHLASAGYDGTVRIWHAPFNSPPRYSGEGLGEGVREAAALVKHLAGRISTREPLVAAIEADLTISAAVRAAAIDQAEQTLLYWPTMLAGHRAAERGDWATAADAFDRVTTLAPDDVMHWHWLAMASLAAGRHETYQRACDEMLRRFDANASGNELTWTLRTWLVSPHDANEKELASLRAFVYSSPGNIDWRTFPWLYRLRAGKALHDDLESAIPPATLGPQSEDWYVLAMIWLQKGDKAQALSAYQAGARSSRSRSSNWDGDLYTEILRREVERLLGDEPSAESSSPPRPTAHPATPSDSPSAEPPRESAPSAAPK